MSHFYAKLEGAGKTITRTGTKGSGIRCELKTRDHSLRVSLTNNADMDHVTVSIDGVVIYTDEFKAVTPHEIVQRIARAALDREFNAGIRP